MYGWSVTSREIQSRERELEPGVAVRAPAAAEADPILRLQRTIGNRQVARLVRRSLARQLVKERQANAIPTSAHAPWAAQTTAINQALGNEIDDLEKLDDKQVRARRAELFTLASTPAADERTHARYERSLEAIEFLAAQRGIGPLDRASYFSPTSDEQTVGRARVRLQIEAGVRRTRSFKQSIADMKSSSTWTKEGREAFEKAKPDVEFFQGEAKEFGDRFRHQAGDIADKMLAQSLSEILDTTESYGLRRQSALLAAGRIAKGADTDEVVKGLANAPVGEDLPWFPEHANPDKDPKQYDPWVKHRVSLNEYARALRAQQRIVKRDRDAAAPTEHGLEDAEAEAKWSDANQTYIRSQTRLTSMWEQAETVHPVLAAFRGGERMLEDVDLAALDTRHVGEEMTAVVEHVLPKLAAILTIRARLRFGPSASGYLSPLSLPPVVALTRAVMFVPDGSIRDGVVNDLVDEAQDESVLKYIAAGLLALIVLATLIPSGGASLGIGIGVVSAALSAASAVEDWEHYQKQKLLADTALDRAKALAVEEPSLVPFAIDLIFLGLDGAPLVKAFAKAVELRNLVRAGESVENAKKINTVVGELNDLGKGQGKLGEKALQDVRAAEDDAQAAAREPASIEPRAGSGGPKGPRGFDEDGRITRSGNRAVYDQGPAPTCGPVSCGMVINTAGQPVDLAELVKAAGPEGTPTADLVSLLKRNRVVSESRVGVSIADIRASTRGGNPVIAVVRNTSATRPKEVLHAIVIDGVTKRLGHEVLAIRDPWGLQYFELTSTFQKRFTSQAIITLHTY